MINLKIFRSIGLFYVCISYAALINLGCGKTPQEPPEHIHHDHEVVVVDSFHVHHDHTVVVIDTIFQNEICDSLDMVIEWTVTGDESAPNKYPIYLNDFLYALYLTEEFPFGLTEVKFEIEFFGLVFGDVIRIEKEGSKAEVISISIIDIKCSGRLE